ncbi:chromate efflux transporter [Ottowia testudinis]|uniref:Chromate efflux transporter n=1 Tax=Ottowia testudinis TaxID=2816950 RepID=A0A975CGG4_9BURK|nr:chromate efflux transporter [Ottowia testudinis]QTD45336.1 chromate efflux transporter [Ottowia testudinis]
MFRNLCGGVANRPPTHAPPAVPFGAALRFWLKLGCISFGGPAGQIAIMHRELVEQRRWISEPRFLHALNYCMVLPGPEAQQLATYIGWLLHGTRGGIAAGALFVLPSLLLLIALSAAYLAWGQLPWVAALFYGIKAAVAAIVLHAMWRLGGKTLKTPLAWALACGSLAALAWLKWPFPVVVLGAGAIGWLAARVAPAQVVVLVAAAATPTTARATVIDDHAPPPPHACFSRRGLARVLGVGALLWVLSMGALIAWQGWQATLTQMGWFFSKAALITFGGAYAVLPYVNQAAVQQHQWLTAAQMMDGLALGETTPGPLIMIVAFVGQLGATAEVVRACGGASGCAAWALGWGAVGALVATWFTFLPSFVFILAGGPLVESTRGKLALTAPLAAITAAVVGVIGSLALFFIAHVAFPAGAAAGFDSKPDWAALALVAAAAWALARLRWGVIRVIVLCALGGGALRWAGLA